MKSIVLKAIALQLSCLLVIFGCPSMGLAQSKPERKLKDLLAKPEYQSFSGIIMEAEKGVVQVKEIRGYRNLGSATKLLETDIFEIASLSKQFTAMIIMMLKEKGLLSYDDPLEKYIQLPYKGISIRNLLTHTSGLPDYQEIMNLHWDKQKIAGNADCIEYLVRYAPPALFAPGDRFEYSNTGYMILASVAEKITGRDFVKLTDSLIFSPLKMKGTRIRSLSERAGLPNFAWGYTMVDSLHRYMRADSLQSSNYTIWLGNRKGPGRVSSTAPDLLLWDEALYTNNLVSKRTLEEAFSPMKLNGGSFSDYGFGWMLRKDPKLGRVVYHTGSNPGYHTLIVRCVDLHKTLAVLSNNEFGNIEGFNVILLP